MKSKSIVAVLFLFAILLLLLTQPGCDSKPAADGQKAPGTEQAVADAI